METEDKDGCGVKHKNRTNRDILLFVTWFLDTEK